MKPLLWAGLLLIACWGILWLGLKLATLAIHLLLLLGVVLVGWALLRGNTSSP